jgi:hypothetical protein
VLPAGINAIRGALMASEHDDLRPQRCFDEEIRARRVAQ